MAKNHMDEEFIITNGDNIFKEDVFRDLVQNNSDGIFLTINKKDKYDEDDMKVNLENDKLIQVSKTIPLEESNAESVGLVYVSGNRYTNVFRKAMERLVRNFEYRNKFWLEIFNKLSLNGVNIKTFEIDGETKWKELDFHPDIENVKKIIGI
jgi:choline kinase